MRRRSIQITALCCLFAAIPQTALAMHIAEGMLPPFWCIVWAVASIPFVAAGLYTIRKIISEKPRLLLLLAMAGAFTFVLSALKMPSISGSSSHPTGVGLGTILFGPTAMSVIGLIVLLFQALLPAHGGISTLGANTFSMAVAGPLVAAGVYFIVRRLKAPQWLAVFLAACLSDLATYLVTAFQLALAWSSEYGGLAAALIKFIGVFAITQIPLAISEGILTVLIFRALASYGAKEFKDIKAFAEEVPNE